MARPTRTVQRQRKARFLTLMADDETPADAVRGSGIDPMRALEVMSESDFLEVVAALRAEPGATCVVWSKPPLGAAA